MHKALSPQSTTDPVKLVAAATNWYANRTQPSAGSSVSNSKPAYILPPTWKEAEVHSLSNGQTVIIAPGPDFKLNPNSSQGFLRKFVFSEMKGAITGGRIVEIFGAADYISANKATLLENYVDGKMSGFTGTVITYDARYHYVASEVFNNGNTISAKSMASKKAMARIPNDPSAPVIESTKQLL